MAQIPEGYGLIAGRNRATAQAALAAAEKAGVDVHEVRSSNEGYIVPAAVLDAYQGVGGDEEAGAAAVPVPGAADVPDESWKNADIEKWAKKHHVDLGEATKKADMLAAISDAGTP
jgi:hypothetical protein